VTLLDLERWTPDPDMAEIARRQIGLHLTGVEKQVVANLARRLPLGDAARVLVRAIARAAGGQVGLINHTTLGSGFSAGPVTAYDISNFLRFDGTIFRAEVDGATLASLLNGANQDEATLFERRVGDFVYANTEPLVAEKRYVIATNGWVRSNARRYLGRDDIAFGELQDRRLRAAFESALRG
jgi:2',3'-cyclic-nucleotide 2'-phosphodiesterase (5'-nucleotidase family)